jgi:hypothetical protein
MDGNFVVAQAPQPDGTQTPTRVEIGNGRKRKPPVRTTMAHNKHNCANMVRNAIKFSPYF